MSFDPETGPRVAAGWRLLVDELSDGAWHPHREAAAAVVAGTDLAPQTALSLISGGAQAGWINRSVNGRRRLIRLTDEGRRRWGAT